MWGRRETATSSRRNKLCYGRWGARSRRPKMNRRDFSCIFTGAVAASSFPAPAAKQDSRPNIVFILTDDQRLDSLGCYGNRFIRTPHIDRLAADGVLFEQATVTSAICTPSRA